MDTVGQEQKAQNSKKRFWIEYEPIEKMTLVMATFAAIYSLVTLGLYYIASRQLDGMKKDQRPWIIITSKTENPKDQNNAFPEKTSPFLINFKLTNVGKSPAKSLHADFFVENVKNGNEPTLNKSPTFSRPLTTGVMFPNVEVDQTIPYTLLQSDWEDFKEGRSFLVIYSHTTYTDDFKAEHWTDYCGFDPPKAGIWTAEKCTDYNNVDDN